MDEKKKINFFKNREECEIVDTKEKNCISFKVNHPEFDELLIPCLEFLTRAYGLSTELIRILTTYNESERESRLYIPHVGKRIFGVYYLAIELPGRMPTLSHIINILNSLRMLHVFYIVVSLEILI